MQPHSGLDKVLQKIRELAETASGDAGTPPAVRMVLDEIASLARVQFDVTRDVSDVPQTENQGL